MFSAAGRRAESLVKDGECVFFVGVSEKDAQASDFPAL